MIRFRERSPTLLEMFSKSLRGGYTVVLFFVIFSDLNMDETVQSQR